ncbi:uncharacterized protein LOC113873610 [Abrus precatorius]|uniref:Uncharacterized protein LOC113873610 n=1 Tax=Abrus precatorius TaxID=3816 RepID=A0A8B8MJ20_ABRPR|nr:uncharacterized protein LOC113873610 [Abrus precatorius]
MTRLRIAKKLQPAKRAWNSFSNTVQYKVHKLNIPKAIKATLQRLFQGFHSLSHLIHSRLHHSVTTTRPYATSYYHVQYKHVAAIHIDELFDKAVHATNKSSARSSVAKAQGESGKGKEKEVHGNYNYKGNLVGESSGLNTIEDAWKLVVARSPRLHVDQKAEEFISKFREDMRLQKERSMLEFQEMLARSA